MAVVKAHKSGAMVQILVARGHLPTYKNRYGWTALEYAKHLKNVEAIEILENKDDAERFSMGLKETAPDEDHAVALEEKLVLASVRSGQKDLVHFILPLSERAGEFLDPATGNTSVHYQVLIDDDPDILLMLLSRGGKCNLRNLQGRTAINLAEIKRRQKSVDILVRWGNADEDERREMADSIQYRHGNQSATHAETGLSPKRRVPRGDESVSDGVHDDSDDDQGRINMLDLIPEEPRPASRDSSRFGFSSPATGMSRPWERDINDLLEEPDVAVNPAMGSELLARTLREVQELRAKVEMLEHQQDNLIASPNKFFEESHAFGSTIGGGKDATHSAARYANDFSRPTTGDTMGAAAIEELFYKMHLMQQKIDQHELATERQSQVMTQQQESAIYQINAKMEEITVQQQQAAQMLAETSHKIGSYLQFDKTGAPSQDGKIIITLRAAHGLLLLEPHHPPSPYAVIAIDQQVFITAVAPDTRNPIWEKECIFDVPRNPSRIVISVLDRTILGSNRTVLLGKSHISLNLLTDEDMEDWHDLTTDEFGMVRQHAGSVRVKRRFVPTHAWGEYLKNRTYQANLIGLPDELLLSQDRGIVDSNIFSLYCMILKGEDLSSGLPQQNVMLYLQLDQGTNTHESTKYRLSSEVTFGKSKDEIMWRDVDARQKIKIYLVYEIDGILERAAYITLKVDGFPFDEVYEDWHPLEVNAGMGHMKPRVRLAFFRTKYYPQDQPVTCTFCGISLQHQFQAPHLCVFCPKYTISCPHARIGCSWSGARLQAGEHLKTCSFEALREGIYATTTQISGIQDLLVAQAGKSETMNQGISNTAVLTAQTPQLVKTLKGHKKPVTCLTGLIASRKLISGDQGGVVKVWDINYDDAIDHIQAHTGEVTSFHYNAEFPSKVFSGGAYPDDTIKFWDSADFHCEKTMLGGGQNFAINGLSALRYGIGAAEVCRLYSVDDSAVLREWDIETAQCLNSIPAHELGIKCCLARDGLIMTGSLDMSVKIFEADSLNCVATLDCVGDSVMRIEIVQNAWLLAAGTNSIKIWDMRSRKLYRILDGCQGPVLVVDALMYCVTYNVPQNIQVWDVSHPDPRQWKVLDYLIAHQSDVTDLCWFQQCLCSSSFDRTIGIWQAPPARASR